MARRSSVPPSTFRRPPKRGGAILLALVALAASAVAGAQSSSPSFRLQQSTLSSGGGTSVSPSGTNFRVSGSFGQEATVGASSAFGSVVQSGFWGFGGSALVPVLLTVRKNVTVPGNPDLTWTGNDPDYRIFRDTNCADVTGAGALLSQSSRAFTDTAPPAAPLVCYSVFATAPGPIPNGPAPSARPQEAR